MPSVQDIYRSAASVASQTGVDPAIIASIAQTETGNLAGNAQFTLGISSASPSGKGATSSVWGSSNTYGGTQPAGFWTYSTGADAAQAFKNFLDANSRYATSIPFLSDAQQFFKPGGPFSLSGYYVPTAGEIARAGSDAAARLAYATHWQSLASAFSGGGSSGSSSTQQGGGTTDTLPGVTNPRTVPEITGQVPGTTTVPGQTTVTAGAGGGGGSSGGASATGNPTFTDSLMHLLVTAGLIIVAIVLAFMGIMLMTGQKVEETVQEHPEAAAAAAEVAA